MTPPCIFAYFVFCILRLLKRPYSRILVFCTGRCGRIPVFPYSEPGCSCIPVFPYFEGDARRLGPAPQSPDPLRYSTHSSSHGCTKGLGARSKDYSSTSVLSSTRTRLIRLIWLLPSLLILLECLLGCVTLLIRSLNEIFVTHCSLPYSLWALTDCSCWLGWVAWLVRLRGTDKILGPYI